MCTVTFIPLENSNFVLTSNRDEALQRKTLDPDFYLEDGVNLLYPKDKMAGGTWIGVSDKQRLICLLNGGFTMHERQDKYRLSRGVVVKDLLTSNHVLKTIEAYNLLDVEPFTIVLVDWQEGLNVFEFVWDGIVKHIAKLPLEPRIWSSSSLYTKQMKRARIDWFEGFKNDKKLTSKNILEFHNSAGKENLDFGIIMDRGFVKTTSITQVEKCNQKIEMTFINLQDFTENTSTFNL
ncbi:NRDE family protein [Xanthomarina sp. F2636L]|uniref:NRDE family protein n=1 Tax=Xanthomarina sp. F2636L TaxID=2996018 RepID=UPI00225DE46B|nr:NRDE family protein [Xanthomarina sp. F2636L]MCX7550814.1 NRDE family protein [Xanthomarina sp. F2636L]